MKQKLLLLLAMVAIFATTASAQESKTRVKYHGEVFVAGDVNWSDMSYVTDNVADRNMLMYGASIHTIQGMKIGEYLSLGLGIGFDLLIGDADGDEESDGGLNGLIMPMYLDCKAWIPTECKVKPFFMAEAGGSFTVYPGSMVPMFGAGVGFNAGRFAMSLGYVREGFKLKEDIEDGGVVKYFQHKLQLRVGVAF